MCFVACIHLIANISLKPYLNFYLVDFGLDLNLIFFFFKPLESVTNTKNPENIILTDHSRIHP